MSNATKMTLKKWKIGFAVAILFSLFTAGAGVVAGMNVWAFVSVLCTSLVTNLGAYLMKHPVEDIDDGSAISLGDGPSSGNPS